LASNAKNNPKAIFKYVNSKKSVKQSIRALLMPNGSSTTNEIEIATLLNNHFKSVYTIDDNSVAPKINRLTNATCSISDIQCFSEIIKTKLLKLKKGKASGPDSINSIVLKNCAESLSYPLSMLFKESLRQRIVPLELKQANITPIFKKGSRLDASNYRPVSLTSIAGKILEGCIKDAIMRHLRQNNLISKNQHGFIANKSCTTNLLESLDFITLKIEEKSGMLIIYLDFSKAFDRVCHRLLAHKLLAYGFKNDLIEWIASFLSERRQRVILGEAISDWTLVMSGVPQGTVLGPTLFTIYINDLIEQIRGHVKFFADDSRIICTLENADSFNKLVENVEIVMEWCNIWKMSLNTDKCKYRGHQANLFTENIDISNLKLIKSQCERDLGIMVTDNLKWHEQSISAASRANKMLGLIKHSFKTREPTTIKKLYCGLDRPLLEYAAPVWNPYQVADINILEKVQMRASKLPLNCRNLSYDDRQKSLNLQRLSDRRTRGDLIQLFKSIYGIDQITWQRPIQLKHPPGSTNPSSSTRGHQLKLVDENCKSAQRKYFFTNRIIPVWKKLPHCCVAAKSISSFKNHID
jgi:hypothetical protein